MVPDEAPTQKPKVRERIDDLLRVSSRTQDLIFEHWDEAERTAVRKSLEGELNIEELRKHDETIIKALLKRKKTAVTDSTESAAPKPTSQTMPFVVPAHKRAASSLPLYTKILMNMKRQKRDNAQETSQVKDVIEGQTLGDGPNVFKGSMSDESDGDDLDESFRSLFSRSTVVTPSVGTPMTTARSASLGTGKRTPQSPPSYKIELDCVIRVAPKYSIVPKWQPFDTLLDPLQEQFKTAYWKVLHSTKAGGTTVEADWKRALHNRIMKNPRNYISKGCTNCQMIHMTPTTDRCKRERACGNVDASCDRCIKTGVLCAQIVVVDGKVMLGFLPLPQQMRHGVEWWRLGFWVHQSQKL